MKKIVCVVPRRLGSRFPPTNQLPSSQPGLASPMTGTVPMPGVPLVSVVPIPFVSPAEAQPVATVAPVPGSLVRL